MFFSHLHYKGFCLFTLFCYKNYFFLTVVMHKTLCRGDLERSWIFAISNKDQVMSLELKEEVGWEKMW